MNDTREFDHHRPFATADGAVFVNAGKDFRLTLSVTNIFNRIGERYNGYIVPTSINDSLGRRFAISFQRRW